VHPHQVFERQIERIHKVLNALDAKVTWDDRIPDPDNPNQSRQIDISIRRNDGSLTLIECRHRKVAQDVSWVEELAGRRLSLRATGVIGVSSSGFTQGAIQKGKALGVTLRDFESVSVEEAQRWGELAKLTLMFYEFRDVEATVKLNNRQLRDQTITDSSGHPLDFCETLLSVAEKGKINWWNDQFSRFEARLVGRAFVGGLAVTSIDISGRLRGRHYASAAPTVSVYRTAGQTTERPEATVERFSEGQSQVIKGIELSSIVFDLSQIKIPERCIFVSPMIAQPGGMRVHHVDIVGLKNILRTNVPIRFTFQ
jgi:hypothetical protein